MEKKSLLNTLKTSKKPNLATVPAKTTSTRKVKMRRLAAVVRKAGGSQ